MSPFDPTTDGWEQRARRYHRLSVLLREDKPTGPLRGLALEVERHVQRLQEMEDVRAARDSLMRYNAVLVAEIDAVLARIRGNPVPAPHYNAADVREESRLCVEEARAAADDAVRRSLSSRAFELAQRAEQMERRR